MRPGRGAPGRIRVPFGSNVRSIDDKLVVIESVGIAPRHRNDAVILCAGGLLPTPLPQKIGIQFDTQSGTA